MSSNFTVVYDACTLYSAPLRDLLMRLAITDLFRARWTEMIHDEWTRNLIANRPDLDKNRIQNIRTLMNKHVRDCLVTGFEHLIEAVTLKDKDDRHVVAAAIHSGAQLIVTFNLADFPSSELDKYGICAQHPDDFIIDLMSLKTAKVCEAVANHRRSLKNPPKTVDDYLNTLLAQGLTRTVNELKNWKAIL